MVYVCGWLKAHVVLRCLSHADPTLQPLSLFLPLSPCLTGSGQFVRESEQDHEPWLEDGKRRHGMVACSMSCPRSWPRLHGELRLTSRVGGSGTFCLVAEVLGLWSWSNLSSNPGLPLLSCVMCQSGCVSTILWIGVNLASANKSLTEGGFLPGIKRLSTEIKKT